MKVKLREEREDELVAGMGRDAARAAAAGASWRAGAAVIGARERVLEDGVCARRVAATGAADAGGGGDAASWSC